MPWEQLDALRRVHVIAADSADKIVWTSDGRTGDSHEFHMEAASLQAALDSAGSSLAIWATEPALPYGTYDPRVGCASRNFRLVMSRVSAELLRDALIRELGAPAEELE
jgi:hypothetical protein